MKRTILQCDRCGNIITRDQYMQVHFPRFDIKAQYNITSYIEIDLCNDCSDELNRWIEEGKDNEKDPT